MLSELSVGHSYQAPGDDACATPSPCPAGCSAPTTRSRTGATASEGLRRSQLEPRAALAAHRARRRREGGRVPARGRRQGTALPARTSTSASSARPGASSRSRVGPNARRQGLAHRQGRAGRRASAALRNRDWVEGNLRRVDRGDAGPRGLRVRAEHGRPRPHLLQALLLPAGRPARRSSSTSGTTAAARSPTTTSTSCAGPLVSYWAMRYGADLKTPDRRHPRARR